jgi:copper chaperone CopZ
MTCAGCETTIKLALEKTVGVRVSEVSYDRGEAVVEYDPKLTTPEKLREAIGATGYPAEVAK